MCDAGGTRREPPAITSCRARCRRDAGTNIRPRCKQAFVVPWQWRWCWQFRIEQWRQSRSASQYSRHVATCAASTSARPCSNVRRLRYFSLLMVFPFSRCTLHPAPLRTPSPRLRGEGGVRGRCRRVQSCGAQNRGEAPSPSLRSTSPRTRGEVKTSNPVLAMRFAPESSSRDRSFSALRADLRQRMPAVDAGILTICASSHECKKRKQGSGTPRDAYPTSAPKRGAARAERCALASRRPTTALCHWEYFIPRLNLGQAS